MVDHHWFAYKKDEEFVPNLDKFGFVYLITNLQSGKGYIGCKQYKLYTKLKERESDWKTYTGSSKWLNEDIKKIGKEHFKFEIIAEYKNKRSLRYYELYYQMKFNVLSSVIEGTDEPAYYNSRVGGKFYRPVESYEDPEYRKKLSEREFYKDPEYRKKLSEREYYKDPDYRKKLSEREFYKDPKYRKKNKIHLNKKRNTKRDPVTGRYIKQNVQA
tara:strand:- start:365 stop:1009 length:645 start_codon:yes stop_codon:yes gene_type:complete